MTDTATFLRRVLPSEGWYCLFLGATKSHLWFQNIDEMATRALALAPEQDIYFGTAAFTVRRRLAANARALRAFRLDLDAGPGKPYADARAAYLALEAWREKAAMPPAWSVLSGRGLHVYWPLVDPLDPLTWKPAAERLKQLCVEHGLHADPATTADAARILRPPGTVNHKGEKLPVAAGPSIPSYAWETLRGTLSTARVVFPMPPLPMPDGNSLEDKVSAIHDETPADPLKILAGCAQLQHFQSAGGRIAEPLWYAHLGLLAYCGEPGRTLAHQFSSGDGRYSAEATEKKLDQAREAAGPSTCNRFKALNQELCKQCPHDITSPILLGRMSVAAPILAPKAPLDELPQVDDPWSWDRHRRLVISKPTEEGKPPDVEIISDYPCYIAELQTQERAEGISALFRTWEPMVKAWREFILPLKDVMGERGYSWLAHHGVIIRKKVWGSFQAYLTKQANNLKGGKHYGVRFEQFGWKEGGSFLIGSHLLRSEVQPVQAYGSPEVLRRAKAMPVRGGAAAWAGACNGLFALPGMEGHAFAVLCGFAAPLYALTGATGLTISHMRSQDSGKGKSHAMECAATIFGELDGFRMIATDTPVAKFIFLGVSGNLPVVFDEFRDPDPEVVRGFVLQSTLGRDKNRGDVHGGLRDTALPWATILLTASNTSLQEVVREGGESAQAARIFEYAIDRTMPLSKADGDRLLQTCRDNCGAAGRVYLQYLVDHRESVAEMVLNAMRTIEGEIGSGPEQRFVIRLLGCVAVAGLLARQLGLAAFDIAAVLRWAADVSRGTVETASRSDDLAALLGELMNDLLPGTLVMPGPVRPGPVDAKRMHEIQLPRGALIARYEVDSRLWQAHDQAVRKWMVARHKPFIDIERQLLELKVLKRRRPMVTLGRGHALGVGQVRVWEIDCRHPLVAEIIESLVPAEPGNVVQLRGAG